MKKSKTFKWMSRKKGVKQFKKDRARMVEDGR